MEIHFEQNLIDQNIFWDIHNDVENDGTTPTPGQWAFGNGTAIRSDCSEKLIITHNFFEKVSRHAISLNVYQSTKLVSSRTGIGYANKILNNVFYDTPNRVYIANKYENTFDGNLYDSRNDNGSFLINYPEPIVWQNLSGWKEFFGLDTHSTQAGITANFDPETCILEISIEGDLPQCQSLGSIMNGKITKGFPGPFLPDQNQLSQQPVKIKQKFPIEL